MEATRESYGKALVELGKQNENVVVLDADLSCSTKSAMFGKAFPHRFFNIGIAEQNLMTIAAGLASAGKIVFASTFAMFATGRAFDQVRNSIAYSKLNVRVVGTHCGIMTGEDGVSHQATEDIAIMRVIPGMTVICPADEVETKKAVFALANFEGPAYLRLGRAKVPTLYNETYDFKIGKGSVLKNGTDVTLIATGSLVHPAFEAAEKLSAKHISAEVINLSTIKPIDAELIIASAKKTKAVVTCEDHNIIGGLGGAVAEVLSREQPSLIEFIGVNDIFTESGSPSELYEKYGLTSDKIVEAARNIVAKKKNLRWST